MQETILCGSCVTIMKEKMTSPRGYHRVAFLRNSIASFSEKTDMNTNYFFFFFSSGLASRLLKDLFVILGIRICDPGPQNQ